MNQTAIAKTLLTIWPGLNDYAAMLSERAHTHALCSCNTPFFTTRIIDKIIDLNVKQQTIHTLAERLNHIIHQLAPVTQAVIRSYYRPYGIATNISVQATRLKVAERTFYRHLNRAITYVSNHLNSLGINFFTWQDLLHQHLWIKETFTRQCPLTPPQTTQHQKELNHSTAHQHQHTKRAN